MRVTGIEMMLQFTRLDQGTEIKTHLVVHHEVLLNGNRSENSTSRCVLKLILLFQWQSQIFYCAGQQNEQVYDHVCFFVLDSAI